jgi:hypothetical protein
LQRANQEVADAARKREEQARIAEQLKDAREQLRAMQASEIIVEQDHVDLFDAVRDAMVTMTPLRLSDLPDARTYEIERFGSQILVCSRILETLASYGKGRAYEGLFSGVDELEREIKQLRQRLDDAMLAPSFLQEQLWEEGRSILLRVQRDLLELETHTEQRYLQRAAISKEIAEESVRIARLADKEVQRAAVWVERARELDEARQLIANGYLERARVLVRRVNAYVDGYNGDARRPPEDAAEGAFIEQFTIAKFAVLSQILRRGTSRAAQQLGSSLDQASVGSRHRYAFIKQALDSIDTVELEADAIAADEIRAAVAQSVDLDSVKQIAVDLFRTAQTLKWESDADAQSLGGWLGQRIDRWLNDARAAEKGAGAAQMMENILSVKRGFLNRSLELVEKAQKDAVMESLAALGYRRRTEEKDGDVVITAVLPGADMSVIKMAMPKHRPLEIVGGSVDDTIDRIRVHAIGFHGDKCVDELERLQNELEKRGISMSLATRSLLVEKSLDVMASLRNQGYSVNYRKGDGAVVIEISDRPRGIAIDADGIADDYEPTVHRMRQSEISQVIVKVPEYE